MRQVRLLPRISSFRCFRIPHFRLPISGQRCAEISAKFLIFLCVVVSCSPKVKPQILSFGWRPWKRAKNEPPITAKSGAPSIYVNNYRFLFRYQRQIPPRSEVYYPKRSDTNPTWSPVCPLRPLKWFWVYGLLQSSPCQKDRLTEKLLIQTMQTIDKNVRDFKIYSIRIGAHTFFMR